MVMQTDDPGKISYAEVEVFIIIIILLISDLYSQHPLHTYTIIRYYSLFTLHYIT